MYYKPLENLNQTDIVQVNSIGKQEQGKFGPQYQCEILVNGQPMQWTLSQEKLNQFHDGGFKEGDTVKIEKWRDGVKKGYNFKSPDAKNPYSQTVNQPTPPLPTEKYVNEKPDSTQDKIIRGMCFNNACQMLSGGISNGKIVSDENVKLATISLYKTMSNWLQGNE